MSDRERLATYVATWWQAIEDFTGLLERVPAEQWSTPTDLPGWDVKAVAAHTAHLESVLATGVEEQADIGEPSHVTGLMGMYTEIGVVNRRDREPATIIEEIRSVARKRYDALLADPPSDGGGQPPMTPGGVPWTWQTLLRNRPLDVWMHEQDVRRAVGLPGGMDTPAAAHTADYLAEAFAYVVGKKVAPPIGTTAVLEVEGSPVQAVEIDENGRGRRLREIPGEPTVRLATDRETFVLAAGGRRPAQAGAVRVEGDTELGRRIVDLLATTP